MISFVARSRFVLAALVLVVGTVHTAFEYGLMVGTEEYNSAPSSVALVVITPYALVSAVLLVVGLLVVRRVGSR